MRGCLAAKCDCGHDRFIVVRMILHGPHTSAWSDELECESCGAHYVNPGRAVAFKEAHLPAERGAR